MNRFITLVILPAVALSSCSVSRGDGAKARENQTGANFLASAREPAPGHAPAATRLTVNGETVEAADLWPRLRAVFLEKARTLGPRAYQELVERTAAQLITDKIAEVLLYQQASLRLPPELETRVDEIVDTEIRKVIARDHSGIRRRYEQNLKEQGQTVEDVRRAMRREILIARHMEESIKQKIVEPSRAELLAIFRANREAWRRPPRKSMSLIDIRAHRHLSEGVTDPTPQQLKAARTQARATIDTVLAELGRGAAFAELAKRYSDGLHAAEGGVWGWVTKDGVRERFVPAVEMLEELDPGEVSTVVEVTDGFFLVRCDELDPGLEPEFEAVQAALKERHYRANYNRLLARAVGELRAKARIEPADLDRYHAAVVAAAPRPETGTTP